MTDEEDKIPNRKVLEGKRITFGPGKWFDISRNKYEGETKEFIRIHRHGQNWSHTYNFKDLKQWKVTKKYIEKMMEKLNWDKKVKTDIKEIDKVDRYKKLYKEEKEKVDSLLKELGNLRSQKLSSEIPNFKKDLEEFKKILKDGSGETNAQEWLESHTWFFGPKYLDQEPKKDWFGDEFDFMLQRYDTFYDVIELKPPNEKLFVGKGESPSKPLSPSSTLKKSISQVIEYLEKVSGLASYEYYRGGNYTLKPEGIIVIGRSKNTKEKEEKKRVVLNSYLHGIQIITYDNLLEKARNFVKMLEERED